MDPKEYCANLKQKIVMLEQTVSMRDEKIAMQDETISMQDEKIAMQDEKIAMQDELITMQDKRLAEQDKKLAEQDKKLAEQETKLAEQDKKSTMQEKENILLKDLVQKLTADLDRVKETVSVLAAKNIQAKPNRSSKPRTRSVSKHQRSSRTRPKQIDETYDVDHENCPQCGSNLSDPVGTYERVVEEINIPITTIVKKYKITRRYCKKCKVTRSPPVHDALPNSMFGIRCTLVAVSLKALGLSYTKISKLFYGMFGLKVTESTVNSMIRKTAKEFGTRYNEMIDELKQEDNIHGDETGWRVDRQNYRLWAFVSKWTVIYEVDKSRSMEVPKKILDGYSGNITSDSYSAWNHVGETHQRCHVHYIRRIKDTLTHPNPTDEFVKFGRRLRRLLNDSQKCAKKGQTSNDVIKRLETRLDKIISGDYNDEHCIRFVKTLKRERDMLFTFLRTGTDCHNNTAERAIRPNVVIRKITNGHRTEHGAHDHAVLMSIIETCRMRNLNFYDYSMEYLANRASKT